MGAGISSVCHPWCSTEHGKKIKEWTGNAKKQPKQEVHDDALVQDPRDLVGYKGLLDRITSNMNIPLIMGEIRFEIPVSHIKEDVSGRKHIYMDQGLDWSQINAILKNATEPYMKQIYSWTVEMEQYGGYSLYIILNANNIDFIKYIQVPKIPQIQLISPQSKLDHIEDMLHTVHCIRNINQDIDPILRELYLSGLIIYIRNQYEALADQQRIWERMYPRDEMNRYKRRGAFFAGQLITHAAGVMWKEGPSNLLVLANNNDRIRDRPQTTVHVRTGFDNTQELFLADPNNRDVCVVSRFKTEICYVLKDRILQTLSQDSNKYAMLEREINDAKIQGALNVLNGTDIMRNMSVTDRPTDRLGVSNFTVSLLTNMFGDRTETPTAVGICQQNGEIRRLLTLLGVFHNAQREGRSLLVVRNDNDPDLPMMYSLAAA